MALPWPKFLKSVGNSVEFNSTGEMVFYIPEKLYDLKLAFSAGEFQNIFGLVNYQLIETNGKKGKLKLLKLPTRFLTKPYQIDKVKKLKISPTAKIVDYRILRYKKGDQVICDDRVPMEITNVEDLMNLVFVTGNMSNMVMYDKIHEIFMRNMEINGNNYNVNTQVFGILISEVCRDHEDHDKPFRLAKTKDMTAYDLISVKELSRIVTAYSAFTSENFMESIPHAMMNDKKIDQPLERVMTGD